MPLAVLTFHFSASSPRAVTILGEYTFESSSHALVFADAIFVNISLKAIESLHER